MIYTFIILFFMFLIALANSLFNIEPWYYYVIMTTILSICVILIDGLVAAIIRHLPASFVDSKKKIFTMSKKEKKFYEFLGIKKWKDKVPELGGFTSFHKNKIADPKNNEYLSRYMLEARYGILIHYVSFFTSFLVLLLDYKMYYTSSNLWLTVGLPVAIVNAILIVLPAFILKYNLEKLTVLYKRNERMAKRK